MKILKITICVAAVAIMTSCGSKDEVASKTANSKISKATTELMTKMDANKDGKLSKDEVKGPLSNDFDKYYSEYNYLNTSYNDCTDEFANKCSNTLYSLNTKQSNLKTSLETIIDQLPNDISENFELITKGIPDNAKYDLKKYYIYSLLGTVGLYTIYNEF